MMANLKHPTSYTFDAAWARLLEQIDLHAVRFAKTAVLDAHTSTCVECHNTDMWGRCTNRQRLIAVMGGQS